MRGEETPRNVKALLESFLSTLFPCTCPFCSKHAIEKWEGFCAHCLEGFETINEPFCFRCGYPLASAAGGLDRPLCAACLSPEAPHPLIVRSIGVYSGNIRTAILRVKFGGQAPLARNLGRFMADHFDRFFHQDGFEAILPVPLHPKRLRERGFNQCVRLATPLAARLGVPLDIGAVERVRHTEPQSSSSEADRRKNLKDAFRVRRPERIQGRSILLLDDVYTTGATLQELGGSVLSAGARRVCGLVLARSPLPHVIGPLGASRAG